MVKDRFYFLQTQPFDIRQSQNKWLHENTNTNLNLPIIAQGKGHTGGIVTGILRKIKYEDELENLEKDSIVLLKETKLEWLNQLKQFKAVLIENSIPDVGWLTIREEGIPCISSLKYHHLRLKNHTLVTVDGQHGIVYQGGIDNQNQSLSYKRDLVINKENCQLKPVKFLNIKTVTKIYLDISKETQVKSINQHRANGVIMLRGEVIMAQIGTHPYHLIKKGKKNLISSQIKNQVSSVLKLFPRKPVFYRFSDWQSSQLNQLGDSQMYRQFENNSLLGLRGVYRLLNASDILITEINAIKTLQETYTNLHLVIPEVRAIPELARFIGILNEHHILTINTQLWLHAITPANLILIPQFQKQKINGVIIDLQSISMLVQGVDAENTDVLGLYNDIDPAVIWLVQHALNYAQKYSLAVVVMGDALGKYPELAHNFIKAGVYGLSVSSENIEAVRRFAQRAERKLLDL